MDNSERNSQIHTAHVYLSEARRRRGQQFHAVLLKWAANCRIRVSVKYQHEVGQMELFA